VQAAVNELSGFYLSEIVTVMWGEGGGRGGEGGKKRKTTVSCCSHFYPSMVLDQGECNIIL